MSATVGAALAWWARNTPTAEALVFEEETLDYATVESWSSRVARHLRAEGVREGDRVGLFAPNSVPWPVVALGVIKAGAVLVPLNDAGSMLLGRNEVANQVFRRLLKRLLAETADA